MADYWTLCSFSVCVPKVAADYAIALAQAVDDYAFGELQMPGTKREYAIYEDGSTGLFCFWDERLRSAGASYACETVREPAPDSIEADALAIVEKTGKDSTGCLWSYDERAEDDAVELWVRSDDESASLDPISEVIQAMLIKFNLDGAVVIHWANSCSKGGASTLYGGGCYIVTKDVIVSQSSYDWADQQLKLMGAS